MSQIRRQMSQSANLTKTTNNNLPTFDWTMANGNNNANNGFNRAPISENGIANQDAIDLTSSQANQSSILDQIQAFLRGNANNQSKSSTRKGSARATSIQQHLAAVRYAENLDRQTHDAKRSRGKLS